MNSKKVAMTLGVIVLILGGIYLLLSAKNKQQDLTAIDAGGIFNIEKVTLAEPGFVTLSLEDEIIGVTALLPAGEYTNLAVPISQELAGDRMVDASVYADNGDDVFTPDGSDVVVLEQMVTSQEAEVGGIIELPIDVTPGTNMPYPDEPEWDGEGGTVIPIGIPGEDYPDWDGDGGTVIPIGIPGDPGVSEPGNPGPGDDEPDVVIPPPAPDPSTPPPTTAGKFFMNGYLVCLPHRGDGPVNQMCAYGLQGDDGYHYGLLNLPQSVVMDHDSSEPYFANGFFTPATGDEKYDIVGTIEINSQE